MAVTSNTIISTTLDTRVSDIVEVIGTKTLDLGKSSRVPFSTSQVTKCVTRDRLLSPSGTFFWNLTASFSMRDAFNETSTFNKIYGFMMRNATDELPVPVPLSSVIQVDGTFLQNTFGIGATWLLDPGDMMCVNFGPGGRNIVDGVNNVINISNLYATQIAFFELILIGN